MRANFTFDCASVDEDAERVSPHNAAAGVIRELAARLDSARYKSAPCRIDEPDAAARARAIDLALVALAGAMPEAEVVRLVEALRLAAVETQEDFVCEFCGSPTEPWLMRLSTTRGGQEGGGLVLHTWDQYGYALCKQCHFDICRTRWQSTMQS